MRCLLSIIVVVVKNGMNTILSNKSLKPTAYRGGLVPPLAVNYSKNDSKESNSLKEV